MVFVMGNQENRSNDQSESPLFQNWKREKNDPREIKKKQVELKSAQKKRNNEFAYQPRGSAIQTGGFPPQAGDSKSQTGTSSSQMPPLLDDKDFSMISRAEIKSKRKDYMNMLSKLTHSIPFPIPFKKLRSKFEAKQSGGRKAQSSLC